MNPSTKTDHFQLGILMILLINVSAIVVLGPGAIILDAAGIAALIGAVFIAYRLLGRRKVSD